MKTIKLVILLIFVLVLLTGCAKRKVTSTSKEPSLSGNPAFALDVYYINETEKIAFRIPDGWWEVDTSSLPSWITRFLGGIGNYTDVVLAKTDQNFSSFSVNQWVDAVEKKTGDKLTVAQKERTSVANRQAERVRINTSYNGIPVMGTALFFDHNGAAYVLYLCSEAKDAAKVQPFFEEIINSLRLDDSGIEEYKKAEDFRENGSQFIHRWSGMNGLATWDILGGGEVIETMYGGGTHYSWKSKGDLIKLFDPSQDNKIYLRGRLRDSDRLITGYQPGNGTELIWTKVEK